MYPYTKAQELGKVWTDVVQGKRLSSVKKVMTFYSPDERGFKSIIYHEIEQGKLEEALTEIQNRCAAFTVIDGWSYTLELQASYKEMAASQTQ